MRYLPINNLSALWLLLFLYVPSHAQQQAFVQLKDEPEFTITAGQDTHIQLSFVIHKGYHIQADSVNDENLIPSVLSFDASKGMVLGVPEFPQAVELEVEGEEEAWRVYSDVVEVKVPLRAGKGMEKGTYLVNGNLFYQACDKAKCYFPRDLPFSIKVNVE